ncbi:MAG: cation diffusion facilitator family transporter [Clostridia bacterium]|nr:cation diffusion facilitator family transporter [Clostridia bacterium]
MMTFLIKKFIKNYENTSDFKVRNSYGKLTSIVGIIFNVLLFAGKFIAGTLSGAASIIADSFNNLSDASSSIISLIGFKLSEKPADRDHPYGHGRYEYLSGLVVSVLVAAIGINLVKTGIDKIVNPTEVKFTVLTWIILIVSVLVKLYMMICNYSIGKKISSKTLIATGDDSRNDVLTTTGVIVSSIITVVIGFNIDGYATLFLALFILYSAFGLIKDTLDPILGVKPPKELVDNISKKVSSYDNILGIHDLIIHDYGPGNQFASVHVEMDSKFDVILAHDIIDNIENDILKELGVNLVIHYDPVATDDETVNSMRQMISELVKNINNEISIHDLRVVKGVTHTNIVFDLVIPYDFDASVKELKYKITKAIKASDDKLVPVIKVEYSYT